jgi:AraC-like DNA-binding protein
VRNQSFFLKILLFGCILSILPIIIVGAFSYYQSSQEVQKQINHGKIQYIKQVNANVEQILFTVSHTLNNLVDSSLMVDVLKSPLTEYDFQLYNTLKKELSLLQSFDTKVYDLVLLNNSENWIVKNSGLYRIHQYPPAEELVDYFNLPTHTSWELTTQNLFIGEDPDQAGLCPYNISLIKQLPVKKSHKHSLAFANIPACSIAEIINYDEDSEEVMIVNEQSQIMVHSDPAMIGKYLSDTGYFNESHHFTNQSGQFDTIKDEHPFTVTYYKSNFNDWTYISATSIEALTQQVKQIGWLTFYLCLIIIVISIVSIWFMSRKLYSPVNKLVAFIKEIVSDDIVENKNELQIINDHLRQLFSSNSRLENELSQHSQQIRSLFLSRLFTGNLKSTEINERMQYFGFEMIQDWRKMAVLSLQIDTLENTRYEPKDYELLLFAVSNIIEDTVPMERRLPPVWIDQTLVFIISSSECDLSPFDKEIYKLTEMVQQNIDQYLGLSVSIGISTPFEDFKNASRAYQEGIEALKHRIKLGKGVIIHYSNPGKHSIIYHYPSDIESELLDSIKIADKDKAIENLKYWMNKAFPPEQSVREYQISMIRLLNQLLIVKQESGITYDQIHVHQESLYEEILSLQMSDEIEEWFKNRLILPLVQVFLSRRDSQYHNLSEQIIHLIQEHYDQDITLEECASKLHYNANYLSSVFKKETNFTFSDYLAMYRLKVAKHCLIESEMTIREIAENLRYNNSQNFIRSFRKQEGMTPGQYRIKYGKKN